MEKLNDNFCIVPFIHSVVYTNDHLGYCCTAKYRSVRTGNDRITDEFYSTDSARIRSMLLDNERPAYCSECFDQEDAGVASKRSYVNKKYNDTLFKQGKVLDFSNPEIISLDLKFGNECNLSCRMCTPGSSNKVGQTALTIKKLLKTKYQNSNTSEDDYFITKDALDPSTTFDKATIDNIKKLMPQLREIQTAGGESFINEQYAEILNYAVDNGYSDNIRLEVTTNGTKFIEEKLKLITKFSQVALIVSIDGTDDTYEYIRYPFKFSIIEKRLRYLKSYIEDYNLQDKMKLHIACLGQIYNIFHFGKLHEFLENIFGTCEWYTSLNIDMDVKQLDESKVHPLHCSNLPLNILEEALTEYKSKYNGSDPKFWWLNQFEAFVINYKSNDPNKSKTKNYTLMLDKIYKQDYHNYLDPRIVNYLDNLKGDI